MELTAEQLQTIENGEVVHVEVNGMSCVLVQEDVYNRVHAVFDDDLDPRETYAAVLKAWDMDGSAEDAELYKDYGRNS